MYDPVKDAVGKDVQSVAYTEIEPGPELDELVHCFWELKTEAELDEDFELHALPDACVNILLNLHDTSIAGITALHTTHLTLNLGRSFHYVGVQFFPGVWQGVPEETVDHYVGEPYEGSLPLVTTSEALVGRTLAEMQPTLVELVEQLRTDRIVVSNPITASILRAIGDIHSVADMASAAALSPRQLQRTLKATTGFSPHDLLKVLRLQHSFRQDYLLAFADQSHFIHSFKAITGYTPKQFQKRFDV